MPPKVIGVVTFDGFETLDVYGPLGLLVSAAIGDPYTAVLIGLVSYPALSSSINLRVYRIDRYGLVAR